MLRALALILGLQEPYFSEVIEDDQAGLFPRLRNLFSHDAKKSGIPLMVLVHDEEMARGVLSRAGVDVGSWSSGLSKLMPPPAKVCHVLVERICGISYLIDRYAEAAHGRGGYLRACHPPGTQYRRHAKACQSLDGDQSGTHRLSQRQGVAHANRKQAVRRRRQPVSPRHVITWIGAHHLHRSVCSYACGPQWHKVLPSTSNTCSGRLTSLTVRRCLHLPNNNCRHTQMWIRTTSTRTTCQLGLDPPSRTTFPTTTIGENNSIVHVTM